MASSLVKAFRTAIAAGEAAIRINTDEQEDAIHAVVAACRKAGWELRVFDITVGTIPLVGGANDDKAPSANPLDAPGAPTIIERLFNFHAEMPSTDKADDESGISPVILLIRNLHLGFEGGMRHPMVSVIQHIVGDRLGDLPDYASHEKEYEKCGLQPTEPTGKFLVGLVTPSAVIPPEVDPLFKTIDHELPDIEELREILNEVSAGHDEANEYTDEQKEQICRFALGLTRLQAEGVFSSSRVLHGGQVVPDYVWRQKSLILNKEGLVTLHQGKETYKDVSGLTGAKKIISALLTSKDNNDPEFRSRGVLFVGAPGVGKSLLAKAAGNEHGLPTLMVHPGAWMGSLVGETESKTRKGFQIIRAHAPCLAVIDEIEKVMPSSRGGDLDGGVGARMEGTFLTNMNDMTEPVFWVFTANDVKRMHEAFFRAERVDGVFYVQLPNAEQRAAIWTLYLKKAFPKETADGKPNLHWLPVKFEDVLAMYKKQKSNDKIDWLNRFMASLLMDGDSQREDLIQQVFTYDAKMGEALQRASFSDEGWTPAEIKAACRLSRVLKEPLHIVRRKIRPVSVSAAKVIAGLERWAAESALDAETGELYEPVALPGRSAAVSRNRVATDKTVARRRARRIED